MNRRPYNLHEILEKRDLTDSAFILKFEKKDIEFMSGQHISVGPPNGIHTREYSIYSAPNDDFLEILVKEVQGGLVTPILNKLKVGDSLVVQDPVGYFTMEKMDVKRKKFLFIATGTGISPFHSFVKTFPGIDYKLIHGIRRGDEAYEKEEYEPSRYVACSSRDGNGNYYGRVTDYLKEHKVDTSSECFLCGNCDMIHDVYDILENQGVPSERIHAEVYF